MHILSSSILAHRLANFLHMPSSISLNLLIRAKRPCNPTDICYICAIIDLFSRKVIAYRISLSNSTQLITSTFKVAYKERIPIDNLTFHSDQGSPYTSYSFQRFMDKLKIRQSFSNPGTPHDNAVSESFFATMKKEDLYRIDFQSEAQLRQRVDTYITFFNSKRPHMSLAYKMPDRLKSEYWAGSFSENTELPGSYPDNF